jgi:hypothetical protein
MVDNMNPTSQFHPYQPPDVTPQRERLSGLGGFLGRLGIDQSKIGALGSRMHQARGAARNHPGMVLGGLAALVIGAGLMRKR